MDAALAHIRKARNCHNLTRPAPRVNERPRASSLSLRCVGNRPSLLLRVRRGRGCGALLPFQESSSIHLAQDLWGRGRSGEPGMLPATCRAQGSPAGLTLLLQGGLGRQAGLGTAEGTGAILPGSPEAVLLSQQTDHKSDSLCFP